MQAGKVSCSVVVIRNPRFGKRKPWKTLDLRAVGEAVISGQSAKKGRRVWCCNKNSVDETPCGNRTPKALTF